MPQAALQAIRGIHPESVESVSPESSPWITSSRAAELLGVSARTVQRMCGAGELEYRPVVSGDRTAFEIDGRCHATLRIAMGITDDPALALVEADGRNDFCLSDLSRAKREQVLARYQVVRAWQDADSARDPSMTRTDFIVAWVGAWNLTHPSGERISRTTLYGWQKSFMEKGLAGLIDRRYHHGGGAECDERAWQFFAGLYCRQSRPDASSIYEQVRVVADAEGWAWPSLRTVQRWAMEKLDPALKTMGRDPKRYEDRCMPTIVRDWMKIPAMCLWVGDHRQVDILWPRLEEWTHKGKVKRGWKWRRPWLTMFLDARTWKPVARTLCFDSPNGNRVMATFGRGVMEHGAPEVAYLDNGKDFRMIRFSGGRKQFARPGEKIVPEREVGSLLDTLGIKAVFADPFNARAKVIEPWFKLMSLAFDKNMATYCGSKPERRPKDLKKLAHKQAEFLAGRMDADTFQRIATQAMPQEERDRLTLLPLQTAFDAWLNDDYGHRESPSSFCMGLSASQAFLQLRRPDFVKRTPSEADLALLKMPSVAVRVQPNGIYVRPFGQYYDSPELEDRRCGSGRDLKRKVSFKFDPDDPSKVHVFDFQTASYLCIATPYMGNGCHPLASILGDQADKDRLSEAIHNQRHVAKVLSKQLRENQRFAGSMLLAQSQKAGQAEGLALAADNISIVRPEARKETKVLSFNGEITKAAQAGEAHQSLREKLHAEFEAAGKLYQSTGTDNAEPDGPAPMANPFDFMRDGSTAGTDAPTREGLPDHDDAPDPL